MSCSPKNQQTTNSNNFLNTEQAILVNECSLFLETLSKIIYLKYKQHKPKPVEILGYFNIQACFYALTINATKGEIPHFLERYGDLETPTEAIDFRPFGDPDYY